MIKSESGLLITKVAVLTLALSAGSVFADVSNAVRIGAKEYSTLESAFADAEDNDTVELLKDYTVATYETANITKNGVVLDLGGHTLYIPSYFGGYEDKIGVCIGASAVYSNGTIIVGSDLDYDETAYGYGLTIRGTLDVKCNITRNGGEVDLFSVYRGATINIHPGANVDSYSMVFRCQEGNCISYINIYGGTVHTDTRSNCSPFANVFDGHRMVVNIYDGVVDCESGYFKWPASGALFDKTLTSDCKAKFTSTNYIDCILVDGYEMAWNDGGWFYVKQSG